MHSASGVCFVIVFAASNTAMKCLVLLVLQHVVFKTVILRHTVNPQFDQNFVFHDVTPDCLEKKSLTYV